MPDRSIDLPNLEEKDWFLLLHLAKLGSLNAGVSISTKSIAEKIGSTQQTISRRIISLRNSGFITGNTGNQNTPVKITDKGKSELIKIYRDLRNLLVEGAKNRVFFGKIQTGMGEGKYYVNIDTYFKKFTEFLGAKPYLGTLNILLDIDIMNDFYDELSKLKPRIIESFSDSNRTYGAVYCYDVFVYRNSDSSHYEKCILIDIRRTSHKKGVVEIVSNIELRNKLKLKDDDIIKISFEEPEK